MSGTNVRKIVANYLVFGGLDGLAGENCSCGLDDLFPCGCHEPDQCVPGYRWRCDNCSEDIECDRNDVEGCYRTEVQP